MREARKLKRMSQKRLCALTGMSQSGLSELETGKNSETTYVASLAAALGVSSIWLAENKGPMISTSINTVAELDNAVELLDLYRCASTPGRALILAAAKLADKGSI